MVSASAVRGVVKDRKIDLSKTYSLLGYEGSANPAWGELVKSYRDGYGNMLHEQGVRPKRAKVCQQGKLDSLVQHLTEGYEIQTQ